MDMNMLRENEIECLVSVDELDSRWNVTIEDIIRSNEKGRSVIEFLVSQSQRRFNLNGNGPYEISLQKRSKGIIRFVIKHLKREEFDYSNTDLSYGHADSVFDEQEKEIEVSDTAIDINLSEEDDFPIISYGYKFPAIYEVIRACSVISSLSCSSSLCKDGGEYILILSMKKNIGNAAQIVLSEFTEDFLSFSENLEHEEVVRRYSPNSIVIQEKAVETLLEI